MTTCSPRKPCSYSKMHGADLVGVQPFPSFFPSRCIRFPCSGQPRRVTWVSSTDPQNDSAGCGWLYSDRILRMKLSGKDNYRLIVILSVLLVAGFLFTSLASYFTSRSSLRSQIAEHELPLTSDNVYSEIQRDLLRPIFISSLMSHDTFVRDWVISGEGDHELMIKYLKEIKFRYGTFTSFFVSDRTLTYYHADGILKKVDGREPRDEWYFRVREMTDEYEINVDLDMANQDAMTIFINYRVYDYDGNYIGATGVGLTVDSVRKLIDRYQEKYGRIIYFVDDQGNVTLHGQSLPYSEMNIFRRQGISSIARDILDTYDESFEYEIDGRPVDLNTRRIDEFNWHLIVEQIDNRSHEEIFNTLLINLLICAVVIVVVLTLTGFTVNAYQRRLEKTGQHRQTDRPL